MKKLFPTAILFLFISCRKEDAQPQQIDQVVQLYIDSAGVDMLNTKLAGTYRTIAMKDLGGVYDQAAVTGFSVKKDADTLNYIEYVTGAKRNLKDSLSASSKTYESDILLQLTKKINDSVSKTTSDTMKILYSWTPQIFQVSKIFYNRQLKFTKSSGQPNTVKITK